MYTFVTKNYELRVRCRRGMGAGAVALDSDEVDRILAAEIKEIDEQRERQECWRKEELSYNRMRQVRFFATFCRPIPDDAMEHPLEMLQYDNFHVLVVGEYGYTMQASELESGSSSRLLYTGWAYASKHLDWSIPCEDDEKVAPWLRDLVAEFGGEMVFRACFSFRGAGQSSIDDVCCKHGLPLANATFAKAAHAKQVDLWAFHVHVDGATVAIHPDRVEVTEHVERLTPWSRMVLARPDAHAILVDIAHALAQA